MKHTSSGGNIYQTFIWLETSGFPFCACLCLWTCQRGNSLAQFQTQSLSLYHQWVIAQFIIDSSPSVPETWFQVLPNCLSAANQVHVFSYHFQSLSCLPAFWRVCTRPTHLVSGCCWAHVTPQTAQQPCEGKTLEQPDIRGRLPLLQEKKKNHKPKQVSLHYSHG